MVNKVKKGLGAVILSAIPGLITLAAESLSSWIKGKQNHWIDDAVTIMRRSNFELKQYKDDFLMYGKYSAESLNDVIKTVNALHQKNTRLERLVVDHKFGEVGKDLLDCIAILNQRRLPKGLFSDDQLRQILR